MSEEVKVEERVYEVPESHLFRLLEICSKKNGCKHFGEVGCQCSNATFAPKATPKQRNKKAR